MDASILSFFKPKGIVIIGTSTSPKKLGYGVARNLVQSGYPGAIHFVSQKRGELFGHPLYTELSQVPDPVDLAILIVPPGETPKAIEECGKHGIKAGIIMSSGFREVGREGAALEQQCLQVAREHKIRLLGPNCIGVIDTHLPLDTSFLQPPMPARGHVGFISQSGAFCAAIIDWSRREGFGFSTIVSLGNQVDVNETDALAALAEDKQTHVIVLYMETVADGRRFMEVAREVTRRKPVIALKVGRFESGQKAAASHTGALAASDTAFDAAFEKAGILRAETAEQMFDWARALEVYPRGLEARVLTSGIAILTNAGGPGVIAADALESNGLQLASLSESTLESLAAQLPVAANIHNPVDMLASASPQRYADCLKILLDDNHVNGVLVILPAPPLFKAEQVAEELVQIIAAADGSGSTAQKPVVVALMGSNLVESARQIFQESNVPSYPFPERTVSALGALSRQAQFLATEAERPRDSRVPHRLPDIEISSSAEELLAVYGIPITPVRLAGSVDDGLAIADEIGYPVVMKISSPDILHKSDVAGVVLNIQDADSLLAAYTQIIAQVKVVKPEARINGVQIQQQIADGQEVIAGAVRDPHFGPLMMFGSGGVEVEGLKDVAFALAPLNRAEAENMIRKTWAGRKLRGFRHLPPADEESVIDILIKLSCLISENEFIQEIEINPLRVLKKGAVSLDVRIK